MGYQIFTGHRLETLVEDHLELFRSGFFGPRPGIVLQNQSLAQWLKLFLAGRIGGYVTGDFLYQDEALRRLIEPWIPRSDRLLFLDDLKFELYRYFSLVLTPDADPVFAPLIGGGVPDPLRLFELADYVAGVFHNYSMNSGLWPGALASGVLPHGCDDASFAWQSRVWRDLLSGERGTLAGLVMERLADTPPIPKGPPPQLVLVGSAFLSRRAAGFLTAWAAAGLVEVVQLLLLPAPHPAFGGWPAQRPWSSWGTFGRAFLEALPAPAASLPVELSPCPTALESLQSALARGEPLPPLKPDGTLEIVSCPHPLRELELLRDRLLAALASDPSLEMNEIAVLAPDINVYAPFLDAAFGSDDPGRNLRYHVIDLNLGRENIWFRALDALLALVSGTIDRPTLFALIDTPAFQEAWKLEGEERDLWLDYTEEVSAWREEPQEDTAPQSWTVSWNRLFSGWFRTSADGIPPLDTAPSAFRALGRFHQLVESLRARGRETRRRRSFVEWIRFLDQSVAEFLAPGEGTGAVLSGRLRTLAADAGSPEDSWPWAGFRAFVQDQIAHFPGRRGQLLTEGLHCSSLRPLRAIPFRIIAVLGLDEGRFPHQVPQPSFDLRRHEAGQEEVSSLALDRYSFWETVMAARSLLYLSYQGRSAVDGSPRPPSPVLADLVDFLEEGGSPWPVNEGSVKDFSVLKGSPPTASPRTYRRALAASGPTDSPTRPVRPSLPEMETEIFTEVRQSEVAQAFVTPAKFHLRRVGQVFLGGEDLRGVEDEEPWSLSFLERHAWLQDQLRRTWDGDQTAWDVEEFLSRMEATGRIRPGIFAERDRRELERRSLQAAEWARDLRSEGWTKGTASPTRTLWAGRPWAAEPGDELTRGVETLLPKLLYAEKPPARSLIESALRVLQDCRPGVFLATLAPSGTRSVLEWAHDADQTRLLAAQAETYWQEAMLRPLPFYPDYLEALASRRENQPEEPWSVSAESAWGKARENAFTLSENTLAMDPYAALAFAEPPDWNDVANDLERWWNPLFLPLLKAWQ